MLILKNIAWKTAKDGCWKTAIWRDHESAACLIHLWIFLNKSITCQVSKGSICPLREINILCPLTKFVQRPLADDVKNNFLLHFCIENFSLLLCCRLPTGIFFDSHWLLKMPTGYESYPPTTFVGFVETFSLTTTVNFIDIFPPLPAERRDTSLESFLNSPLYV